MDIDNFDDDETTPARLIDGSLSSFTDEEQLQHELMEFKQRCRTLESENCGLMKMIPQLKNAHGKDYTKELMAAFQREQVAKDILNKREQEYYKELEMFVHYKNDQDEKRRVMNDHFNKMKGKAEQEEKENLDLRKIIADNGIDIEKGPDGIFRQKNKIDYPGMNTNVHDKFGFGPGTDVRNYMDPQFNSAKCSTSAAWIPYSCSPHVHHHRKTKRSLCNRNSVFSGTIVFSFVILIVVIFIHIYFYMYMRQ